MKSEIYLQHTFDAGHRIVGHKGKCARLHGHTYRAEIWVKGEVEYPGFVLDFGDIKDGINQWDHMLLLWDEDPVLDWFSPSDSLYGIVTLPFNPTAENMADYLAKQLFMMDPVDSSRVHLWETPKAYAVGQYE